MISMTQTQLTPIVTAKDKESASFYNKKGNKAINKHQN